MSMFTASLPNILDRVPEAAEMICLALDRPALLALALVSRTARSVAIPHILTESVCPITRKHHLPILKEMDDASKRSLRAITIDSSLFTDKGLSRLSKALSTLRNIERANLRLTRGKGNFGNRTAQIFKALQGLSNSKQLRSLKLTIDFDFEKIDTLKSTKNTSLPHWPELKSLIIQCNASHDSDWSREVFEKKSTKTFSDLVLNLILTHLSSLPSLYVDFFSSHGEEMAEYASTPVPLSLDFALFLGMGDNLQKLWYTGPFFEHEDILETICSAFPNLLSLNLRNTLQAAPWTLKCYESLSKCRLLETLSLPFAPHSPDIPFLEELGEGIGMYISITHALAHENPHLEQVDWEWRPSLYPDAEADEIDEVVAKIEVLRDLERVRSMLPVPEDADWVLMCSVHVDLEEPSFHQVLPAPPRNEIQQWVF